MSDTMSKTKMLAFLERINKGNYRPEEESVARCLARVVREGWFDVEEKHE